MPQALELAAEEIGRQLAERVETIKALPLMTEVLALQKALNGIEPLIGREVTTLSAIFGLEAVGPVVTVQGPAIRPDEYYGLSPLEAAKRYLKRCGEARRFDEILAAVQAGGCKVSTDDEFRLSLSKSTFEIAKIGADYFGLLEFYPHVRRGRKKRSDSTLSSNGSEDSRMSTDDEDIEDAEAGKE